MALTLSSPTSCPLSWVGEIYVGREKGSLVFESLNAESSEISAFPSPEDKSGWPRENSLPHVACQEEINTVDDATDFCGEKANNEKSAGIFAVDDDIVSHEEKSMQEKVRSIKGVLLSDIIQGSESLEMVNFGGARAALKVRKRPSKLLVPAYSAEMEFGEMRRKLTNKEFEVEGRNFVLASKKGRRTTVMEDGYGVMLDILGDPKQALFAVIDGHGGHAAADYVAENLGRNIVKYIGEEDRLEQAIRRGFLVTDKEFLSQGVSSGACAASVLLKEGELHVANVGDCRVVLSRKGLAAALTNEHRLGREDERRRIESSGGFVNCCNGVWRVQGTLAVSRAIGDLHLKQWIISEPEIKKLPLTSDCQFLIMASDGLWDKVDDQEAVDVVLREKNMLMSCKKLADMSCSRGNMDDITVMVINLQNFV